MTPVNETALIELAYAASFLLLVDKSEHEYEYDKPVGEILPAELERECYRLTRQLGLKPIVEVESLETLQLTWRRQLRAERQRQIFDMGMLLVRQHALVGYLQCYPDTPERPELCFLLEEIRQALTRHFTAYKLEESLTKLPDVPIPGAPEDWMNWSGDALRDCVLKELEESGSKKK